MPFHSISFRWFISSHAIWFNLISSHVMSRSIHLIALHRICFHVSSSHVMSCRFDSCGLISFHLCDFIQCHAISHDFTSFNFDFIPLHFTHSFMRSFLQLNLIQLHTMFNLISYHITYSQLISWYCMSLHAFIHSMSCHFISWHLSSAHVI